MLKSILQRLRRTRPQERTAGPVAAPAPREEIRVAPPANFNDVKALNAFGIYLPTGSKIHGDAVLETPLEMGKQISTGFGDVSIGCFTYSWTRIVPPVRSVGRYCSIASEVGFGMAEHPTSWLTASSAVYEKSWMWGRFAERNAAVHKIPPREAQTKVLPDIIIGNDVWIGYRCYIKAGITIADGAVIGAHAVVTRNVPPYAIVAGNPARIIRYRFSPAIIELLLKLKWWDYAFTDLPLENANDMPHVLDEIEARISSGAIKPYAPPLLRLSAASAPPVTQALAPYLPAT